MPLDPNETSSVIQSAPLKPAPAAINPLKTLLSRAHGLKIAWVQPHLFPLNNANVVCSHLCPSAAERAASARPFSPNSLSPY